MKLFKNNDFIFFYKSACLSFNFFFLINLYLVNFSRPSFPANFIFKRFFNVWKVNNNSLFRPMDSNFSVFTLKLNKKIKKIMSSAAVNFFFYKLNSCNKNFFMTKIMKFYSYKFFLSRVLRYDWFFYFINNFFLIFKINFFWKKKLFSNTSVIARLNSAKSDNLKFVKNDLFAFNNKYL